MFFLPPGYEPGGIYFAIAFLIFCCILIIENWMASVNKLSLIKMEVNELTWDEWLKDPMRGIKVTKFQKLVTRVVGRCPIGKHQLQGFTAPTEFWLFWDRDYGWFADYEHGYSSGRFYFNNHPARQKQKHPELFESALRET